MTSHVQRPYLDKMTNRSHVPLPAKKNGGNIHILPNLDHTGVYTSMNPAPPPVSLPDGSLNKAYINDSGRTECLALCRDVVRINARPQYFATKSTKRINRSLEKVRKTTRAVSEHIKMGFCRSDEISILNNSSNITNSMSNQDSTCFEDSRSNSNSSSNNNEKHGYSIQSKDKTTSVKFKDDFQSVDAPEVSNSGSIDDEYREEFD